RAGHIDRIVAPEDLETEEATFDRAVVERRAASLLHAELSRQLAIAGQQPRLPSAESGAQARSERAHRLLVASGVARAAARRRGFVVGVDALAVGRIGDDESGGIE